MILKVDSGTGIIGLWKYGDSPNAKKKQRRVAVKASQFEWVYFDSEAKWHWLISQAKSQHIVNLIKEPPKMVWEDGTVHVVRLLMDAWPLGSLDDLLEKRRAL